MLLRLWPLHQQTEVLLTFHRCLITTSPAGHLYVQRWAAVASVIIKKSIQLLWTHQSTIFSGFLRRFPIFPIFSLGKTILILSCCLLFLLRELNWERRFYWIPVIHFEMQPTLWIWILYPALALSSWQDSASKGLTSPALCSHPLSTMCPFDCCLKITLNLTKKTPENDDIWKRYINLLPIFISCSCSDYV